MPKSRSRKKKKKKPINYSSQKNRKTGLEKNYSILKERIIKNQSEAEFKIGVLPHLVSELILDFGKDYLESCVTDDDYKKTIVLLIASWNVASMPESKREKAIKELPVVMMLPIIEEEIRVLINRKISLYDDYKYFVKDYELSFDKNGDINFSVASFPLNDKGNE